MFRINKDGSITVGMVEDKPAESVEKAGSVGSETVKEKPKKAKSK